MTYPHPQTFALTVEAGPCKVGEMFMLPVGRPQTLGRASDNPIAIPDPLLSRNHCRFERIGDALWVIDLDSANQTLVNGLPVARKQLLPGDAITVGDTRLRITAEGPAVAAVAAVTPVAAVAAPIIDLGLNTDSSGAAARHNLRPILYIVAAIVVLLLGATLIMTSPDTGSQSANLPPPPPRDETLQIIYEKIEATPESIFRYELTLSPDRVLAVRIDDLSQNRSIRKDKTIAPDLIQDWVRTIASSGFLSLDPSYLAASINRGESESRDLTVIIGRRVHRVRVSNRKDPEAFASLRDKLETFGLSELGFWALQYSADKLTDLGRDALLVAQKRMSERDLSYGNIAAAINSFREAEVCLETVDPKPAFFPDILNGKEEAIAELTRRHKEYRFLADRAINLENWEAARAQLRVICELIPDRSDDRHREAASKLLDVEKRLQARRKNR
jgi:hypothetical protein